MKALLRLSAALAFVAFGAAGLLLCALAAGAPSSQDRVVPAVLGFAFIGWAVFTGAVLLAFAEKQPGTRREEAASLPPTQLP